jgi:4-hydroxy-2-oxoheptanedioate aldolase
MQNRLKQIWAEGHTVTNAWLSIPCPWTAEVMSAAGFDSITIDLEHGLIDFETAVGILQAMSGSAAVPLARLSWNDPAEIMRMLDAGALGLICPMIRTVADCTDFVGACRYPPAGYRSYGPVRAALRWGADYRSFANEMVLTFGMIETAQALANVEEIAAIPGLNGLFVGPLDLSISLGLAKADDFDDPELVAALDKVLAAAGKHHIIPGIYAGSPERAIQLARRGFRFVSAAHDTSLLQSAVLAASANLSAGLLGTRGAASTLPNPDFAPTIDV